jgi:hypothetical protein
VGNIDILYETDLRNLKKKKKEEKRKENNLSFAILDTQKQEN